MGSHISDEQEAASSSSVNVLVTGFGAFGKSNINPSYLIASRLPTKQHVPGLPPIRIHTHPQPITVAYRFVRETIPQLLFPDKAPSSSSPHKQQQSSNRPGKSSNISPKPPSKPNFDMALHIGMDSSSKVFTIETCAHRDGYVAKDVLGESFQNDTYWKEKYDAPKTLHPAFDTEDVWRRWKSRLVDEPLHISSDAGHYLCDFIYYTSLFEYWLRDPTGPRPVMFLHVPANANEEDLERGKRVALDLIIALVESSSPVNRR